VPLFVIARPFPAGPLGVVIGLGGLAILLACGPLVLTAAGYEVNWLTAILDIVLGMIAAWLTRVIGRS
jgi:hypothetical protein